MPRVGAPSVLDVLTRWRAWPQGMRWLVGVLAVIVVTLAVGWVLFVPAADWLASHDIGHITGALRTSRLQAARDAARGRLLTFGAGLFAAGALIFTALNFNLLRRNSEQSDQWQRCTHELTEQGQVTDRYIKAIEQLGSDTVDVTIGGIYALERVAHDSPRDHPIVMEVLAACIREHSRDPLPRSTPDADPSERDTRPDVQAAITVIGRRNATHDRRRINLRGANLPNADLRLANLSSVDLVEASLTGATLTWVKLIDANLSGAHLEGADLALAVDDYSSVHSDLGSANLTGAFLDRADLTGASLHRAVLIRATPRRTILTSAHLNYADLTDADFTDADLTDADLTYARLDGANFEGADLTGARFREGMPVPAGWVRDAISGQLERPGGEAADTL